MPQKKLIVSSRRDFDAQAQALNGQKRALELIVEDAPLADVLRVLAQTAEQQSPDGVLASILLLDEDGLHLRNAAAPSIPDSYNDAIEGLAIGPNVGACGAAAHSRKPVIVADIATHPNWKPFRDLALRHGLRACWSTPILSAKNKVLGTFGMYYREPKTPSVADRSIVEVLTRTVALAIERKERQQELLKSEERYRIITEVSPQTIWLAAADGELTYCNQHWLNYTGLTREQTVGQGWVQAIHPDHRQRIGDAWIQAATTGGKWEIEIPFRRFDGEYRWHIAHGLPLKDPSGKTLQWHGVAVDIHDRKQAEERERQLMAETIAATAKFRAVFDQSAIFAGVVTVDGTMIEANRLSLNACGYRAEEVLGRPFWETPWWRGSEEVKAKVHAGAIQAARGSPFREVLPYWWADGTERLTEFALHPIRDERGQVIFLYPTGVDITEREISEKNCARAESFCTLPLPPPALGHSAGIHLRASSWLLTTN